MQGWVDDPASNHGFVIHDYEDSSTDALQFSSREHVDASLRPAITIVFLPVPSTPPPDPGRQPLTNPKNQYDVNDDSMVTPGDALAIINRLNQGGVTTGIEGEENTGESIYYLDVSGDGVISPLDVLMVINYLNQSRTIPAEGEDSPVHTQSRAMLAGTLFQVNTFETWNANPRIIKSTDPAGITYHAPSGRLFIADSEINENSQFNNKNVFETDRTGNTVFGEYWPGKNREPTGIVWNEADDFFYITNDDDKTITRFDD